MSTDPSDEVLLEHAIATGLVPDGVEVLPAKYRTRALTSFLDHQVDAEASTDATEALTVQVTVSLQGDVIGRSTITIPINLETHDHG